MLPKSFGLSVLATLDSLVGLASLFYLATLARLTRLGKVARLDKRQLFGALLWQLPPVKKNTLFLRLALSVDSHKTDIKHLKLKKYYKNKIHSLKSSGLSEKMSPIFFL